MKIYPITPCPKPRMTQADKWKKRPPVMRYRAFADEVRLRGVTVDESRSQVIFTIPMPKSWSKRKKLEHDGEPHRQKPDIDNLAKALLDALFEDDSHIWRFSAEKRWGYTGLVTISERGELNTK